MRSVETVKRTRIVTRDMYRRSLERTYCSTETSEAGASKRKRGLRRSLKPQTAEVPDTEAPRKCSDHPRLR